MDFRSERCDECRFWIPRTDKKIQGECRRFPPMLSPDGGSEGIWPEVLWNEWCGEFKEVEKK